MQRRTQQRDAIQDALKRADRPLSPQEIHESAGRDVENLGLATVYRNVKAMVDGGWLRTVDLPGAPSRYELADKEHHHHFHCNRCDRVFEVDDCPGSLQGLAPEGFQAESHEIILYGRCPECAEG